MTRLSPEVGSVIQQLIDEMQPTTAPGDWLRRRCKLELNALPLSGNLNFLWLLRPDGGVWCLDHESFGGRVEPETDALLRFAALSRGARQFPVLLPLVPERPANVRNCPVCHTLGVVSDNCGFTDCCSCCTGIGWCR